MGKRDTARSSGPAPQLSPVLFAGFALRPLPLALLQPILGVAVRAIHQRHPDIFERLADLDGPVYLVDPVDLPFRFELVPDPDRPSLRALAEDEDVMPTATIRGSLLTLIDLLEGRIDGDALFFSRDLVIEGDTEAVVALRNAVDGAEVDVAADVLARLGPLATPAGLALAGARALFSRAAADLETLRSAVIAPALRRTESHEAAIRGLEEKLASARPTRRARTGGP